MQSHSFLPTKKQFIFAAVLLLLIVPSIWFLLHRGYFLSDDGEWMVIRFSAFYQTLRDGQLPPRFFGRLNHGYGYPIGDFLYPGFMYLATPLRVLGLGFADSVKSVIILSFFASGIGTYLWLKKLFSPFAAVIGALVYVYFPYHLFDLYVRGSVGELLGFAVLPFLLLALEHKKILWGSLLYGLLILSHNTFAFLLTPFLLLYTYLKKDYHVFIIYPVGLAFSSFFWLPSLVELHLTRFSMTTISDWHNYFVTTANSSLLGLISFAVLGSVGYVLWKRKNVPALFFSFIFLISLFFTLPLSQLFWQLPLLPKLAQFPWRFLIVTVWAGSFLTAYTIDQAKRTPRAVLSGIFCLVLIVSAVSYLQQYHGVDREEGYYATNEDTTTTHQEYMPVWVQPIPLTHPQSPVVISKGRGEITDIKTDSFRTMFRVALQTKGMLTLSTIYYPGWYAEVNNKKIMLTADEHGLSFLSLAAGSYRVRTDFGETPLRFLTDILSCVTAIVLFLLLLASQFKFAQPFFAWYNGYVWRRK